MTRRGGRSSGGGPRGARPRPGEGQTDSPEAAPRETSALDSGHVGQVRPRVWGTELRGSLAREHGWGRRLPFRAEENELDQSRHLHLRRRLRALGYIGRNGARRCNRHGGGNRSKDRGSRGAEKAGAGARGPEVAIRHRHRKLDAEGLRGGRGFRGLRGGRGFRGQHCPDPHRNGDQSGANSEDFRPHTEHLKAKRHQCSVGCRGGQALGRLGTGWRAGAST